MAWLRDLQTPGRRHRDYARRLHRPRALGADVGLTAADISRADAVLVGHSHFDHIAGAEVIAANTGAPVIGSNESARVLIEAGISDDLLLRSQGGERHRISKDITIEVFPSLHSCIWTSGSVGPGQGCPRDNTA